MSTHAMHVHVPMHKVFKASRIIFCPLIARIDTKAIIEVG